MILAVGSLDGSVTLCEYATAKNDWLEPVQISAHDGAVTSLSWAPATEPHLLKAESVDIASEEQEVALAPQRFVTGSADGKVKIWALESGEFECVTELTSQSKHDGPVSDVAWRGYNGVMADFIASVSEDETVLVWKCDLPHQPRSSNNQFKR